MITFNTLLIALAFAFILEGLFPALFPNKWKAYVNKLANESVASIRSIGFSIVFIGVIILWLAS